MEIKDLFKNKVMEVINKKGLYNLLSEQLPAKKSKTNVVEPPIKVVGPKIPKKTTQTTTPTQTSTNKKVDPQIKELQNYLSVIRFFSPNGSRINLRLTTELYNDILDYFDGLKDSEPNITLLQALISFLIESERYNVSSFDAPQGYQSQIEMLIQENIITLTSGLKNVLLEQAKRVGYVVKSGKIQKPTPKSADGPTTSGPPKGPLIDPNQIKKTTPPVPPPTSTPTKSNDAEKVTQQEVQQTLQNNVNIKEIKKYSDRIKTTETPRYEACDNLFDNYESQLKLLKKQIEQGLIAPPKGDEPILQDIKTKLKWCYTSSEGKLRFRFKFKQMSSLRDENIKNDKGEQIPNPFKVNI